MLTLPLLRFLSSVGPVAFVILCEISATKVRSKTIAVATAVQATLGIVMTVAIPYLVNPDQANARGKIGFFFGGLAAIGLAWSYFRVPETKGRTYEEVRNRSVQTFEQVRHMLTITLLNLARSHVCKRRAR